MSNIDQYCQDCKLTNWKEATRDSPVNLGSLAAIQGRTQCPKCRWVTRCVRTNATILHLDVPISQRKQPQSFSACWFDSELTLRLDMSSDEIHALFIESKQPENFQIGVRCMKEPYGARLAPQIDASIATQWLEDCEHHDLCQRELADYNGAMTASLTFIDVERRLLVRPAQKVVYIALSYVWGTLPQNYSLTMPNPESENDATVLDLQPVALVQGRLPQTLLDAISFTKSIGQKYVWIDALCIPQSDPAAKTEQISNMDLIYGNALCTLIAVSGKDPSTGIAGVSLASSRIEDNNSERIFTESNEYWTQEIEDFDNAVNKSLWASRAWTLQEGLLSMRKIVFSDKMMYYICPSSCISEASANTPHHAISKPYILTCDIYGIGTEAPEPGRREHVQRSLASLYANFIRLYSSRKLGLAEDCLGAFKGVLSILERKDARFVPFCGIPCLDFGRWLLWDEDKSYCGAATRPNNWSAVNWPSWSWVAHWVPIVNGAYYMSLAGFRLSIEETPLVRIEEAKFNITVDGSKNEPLEEWIMGQRSKAGRRGISHTNLGRIRLNVSVFTVKTHGDEWYEKESPPGFSRTRFLHRRWPSIINFDSMHFGMPLPTNVYHGVLYLVATSVECVGPAPGSAWMEEPKGKIPSEELDLLVLVVYESSEGNVERVGTATIRVECFVANAQLRTLSFDDPTYKVK